MPVTARLSLRFYERLGEEVANELVNWFNEVDATYRSELRELNDANFARLESKLAQLKAELKQEIAGVAAELKQQIAGVQAELIKWTFVFWLGTIGIVLLLLRFFEAGA